MIRKIITGVATARPYFDRIGHPRLRALVTMIWQNSGGNRGIGRHRKGNQ